MNRYRAQLNISMATLAAIVITITATRGLAGGFWITVQSAQLTPDKGGQRVLVVRAEGCHEPERATITAEAIGNGPANSSPLKLKLNPVSPGVYQIARQWPAAGAWILAITSEYNGMVSSVLVKMDADGAIPAALGEPGKSAGQTSVLTFRRKLTSEDIHQAFSGLIGAQADSEHGPTLIWQPLSAGAGLAGLALVGVFFNRRRLQKQARG